MLFRSFAARVEEYMQELKPLLEEEIEVRFTKIEASSIPDHVQITPEDVVCLEPFIEFS